MSTEGIRRMSRVPLPWDGHQQKLALQAMREAIEAEATASVIQRVEALLLTAQIDSPEQQAWQNAINRVLRILRGDSE